MINRSQLLTRQQLEYSMFIGKTRRPGFLRQENNAWSKFVGRPARAVRRDYDVATFASTSLS